MLFGTDILSLRSHRVSCNWIKGAQTFSLMRHADKARSSGGREQIFHSWNLDVGLGPGNPQQRCIEKAVSHITRGGGANTRPRYHARRDKLPATLILNSNPDSTAQDDKHSLCRRPPRPILERLFRRRAYLRPRLQDGSPNMGPNDPAPSRQRSTVAALLLLFVNPLAIVLLIAAVFSAFLGQAVDAVIIVSVVMIGNAINFWQTYRSQRAIEHLREVVRSTAFALRDGDWKEIPRNDVVPGDIVRLFAGDLVPADARLIQSKDLYIQQAALTGESLPVEKEIALGKPATDQPETTYMVFLGASVVSGSAIAEVTATGPRTVFGGIAKRLTVRPEENDFERGLRKFSILIMRVVLFLVLISGRREHCVAPRSA